MKHLSVWSMCTPAVLYHRQMNLHSVWFICSSFSYPVASVSHFHGSYIYVCVLSIFSPSVLIAKFIDLLLLLIANILKSETPIYMLCENNLKKWYFLNSCHISRRFPVNAEALAKDWYSPDYSVMDIIP